MLMTVYILQELRRQRMFAAAAVPVKAAKAEDEEDDNIVQKVDELLKSARLHSSASVSNDANVDDSGDGQRPMSLDSLRKAFVRYFVATSEASTAAEKASKARLTELNSRQFRAHIPEIVFVSI